MKETFITLFDSRYLPQGIALCESLNSHNYDFELLIFCLDDACFNILNNEKIPNIKLFELKNFENKSLKSKKLNRSKAEYCWTLTPWTIQWALELNSQAKRITYLDADLFFLYSPREIFKEFELSGKEVLITKHASSPEYDLSAVSGKFCVQFITFNRGCGEKILHEWRDNCMNWCFNYYEKGKYGDQKYLDFWPINYPNKIHILNSIESAQGPWNANRFPFSDAVFFHFHGFKIISENNFLISAYPIPIQTKINIYKPYIKIIKKNMNLLKKYDFNLKECFTKINFPLFIYKFLYQLKLIISKINRYNIHIKS